jgi:hypothetical protein
MLVSVKNYKPNDLDAHLKMLLFENVFQVQAVLASSTTVRKDLDWYSCAGFQDALC